MPTNAPLTDLEWAAHHVTVWLENDRLYTSTAKRYARAGLAPLRRYAQELLYETRHTVWSPVPAVRDSFARDDFDRIDWSAVRDSLLAD
jgi:hypothetical protein